MTVDKRRIDACLKACKGISTQNLEDNVPFLELARRYNVVLRERDAAELMSLALRAKITEMERQEPADANARLIAAAPDLLEALQQYGIGFTDEAAARAEFGNYEVDRELKRRAAIARATGEQP